MAILEERKIILEKHNFKILLQGLSCFIFITSAILIAIGVVNANFVGPRGPEGEAPYSLVTDGTKTYCQRYTGVHMGIPGLIIGVIGLVLIGVVLTKKVALGLAALHLILVLLGFVITTIITDLEVAACLNAQGDYLRDFHHRENERHENYRKEFNWANLRVKYEFPEKQFPLATYAIIATNLGLLVTVVAQIAAYLLSAVILAVGLGYSFYTKRTNGHEPVPTHEAEVHFESKTKGIKRTYIPKE